MGGTKSTAAAKSAPEVAPTQAPAQTPAPELVVAVKAALPAFTNKEGNIETGKFIVASKSAMSEKQFEEFQNDMGAYFQPRGIVEVYGATWKSGFLGKFHTLAAVAGTALAVSALCEVVGRIFDWEPIQVLSWLARKIA